MSALGNITKLHPIHIAIKDEMEIRFLLYTYQETRTPEFNGVYSEQQPGIVHPHRIELY